MALQTKYINGTWGDYGNGTDSIEWKSRLVVVENSTSNSNNTSSVTISLQFTRARSGGYQCWVGYNTSATLKVNGESKTVTVDSFNYSSVGLDDWKTLCSATFSSVEHSSDGTLNCSVYGYWHQTYASPNTCCVSGSIPLTKTTGNMVGIVTVTPSTSTSYPISTITATDANTGEDTVITITKTASVSLSYKLRYKTNNMTSTPNYITTSTFTGSSYTWTIPARLGAEYGITSIMLYLDNYYNGQIIGTSTTAIAVDRPTFNTTSPIDIEPDEIFIYNSLDVKGAFSAPCILEGGDDIMDVYAAKSHTHGITSGGSLDASDSGGCWIQFNNGFMICWNKRYTSSKTMTTKTVNGVYGGYSTSYTFPKTFTDIPVVITNADSNQFSNSGIAAVTKTGFVLRHWLNYSATASPVILHYIAIGRWK